MHRIAATAKKTFLLLPPFARRLLWTVRTGEPGCALVTLDLLLCREAVPLRSPRQITGFWRGLPRIEDGTLHPEGTVPAARLRAFMESYLRTGRWRDGTPITPRSPWEKFLPWVYRLVKSGITPHESDAFLSNRNGLAAWLESQRPDMGAVRLDQAIHRAFLWRQQEDARRDAPALRGRLVTRLDLADCGDSLLIYRLGVEHLAAEGRAMQHCADNGDCHRWVASGQATFYSVWRARPSREGSGEPTRLFTLDVSGDGRQLVQFQGYGGVPARQNTVPEAVGRVVAWLHTHGIRTRCPDLAGPTDAALRLSPKEIAQIIRDLRAASPQPSWPDFWGG